MGLLPLRQTIEKGDYYDNADRHRAGSLGDAVRPVRHRDHLFRVEGADKGRYEQTAINDLNNHFIDQRTTPLASNANLCWVTPL